MEEPDVIARRLPAGRMSLIQGRYGSRGNLELAYADAVDGLWVHWRNNDETAAGSVAPGAWSDGLRFAEGRRYGDVAMIQARRGPDFLELLATTDESIERWTWSPGAGFERTGSIRDDADGCVDVRLTETAVGFVATAHRGEGLQSWSADAAEYPRLDWSLTGAVAVPADLRPRDRRVASALAVGPAPALVAVVADEGAIRQARQLR